jgi:1-acyl-sn-glycerol-3-phosphate acyltransferase
LKSGAVLAFFPEGDSGSREGELMPLQRGIGHFILRADYPILPIALSGTLELYWQKEITLTIGKPFRVNVAGLNHRAAIGAAVEQVTKELRAILPPYQEPVVVKKRMKFLTMLLD